MGFYSDIKKNEILSFTSKWMELESIILARFKKTKITSFLSYVENRSNTNTSIIIYTYEYIQNMSPKVELLEETREE
jgi:hypothetical protein